jgi:predicted HTH domain antitoxin
MATKPKRFTVRYQREQDVWVATTERAGEQSRSRSLKQVQARIRKALALRANVKPEQLELEHEVWLPSAARSILNAAQKANMRAEAEVQRAQEATRTAAFKLVKSGMSLGDVATLLGMSLQQVQQILANLR